MDQVPITFTHVSIENIKQEIMNGNENSLNSTKTARDVEELYDDDSQSEDSSLQHIKEEIDIEVAKLEEIDEEQNTRLESESDADSKGKLSSEGILTLILPSNDRTDLLVRCTPCQRIYVGMDGWMRHKKAYECYPVLNNDVQDPSKKSFKKEATHRMIKKQATAIQVEKSYTSDSDQVTFIKEFIWKGPRRCKFCDQIEEKRGNMKNHTLNHFKEKLYSIIRPVSLVAPFPCPICEDGKEHRDKITFLRHYAFSHKKIYEFCSDEDLVGVDMDEADIQAYQAERATEAQKRPGSDSNEVQKKKTKKNVKEEAT